MNIPWLRKTVKFYSECPIITDVYPIYPARDYKRQWPRNCGKAFTKYKKVTDGRASTISVARCPGMRNVMEEGWIVQTWHDFTIETSKDGYNVYYPTPLKDFLERIDFKNPLVNSFDTNVAPMKIPTKDYFDHIFKVFIPYSFDIPKGYELRIMPVAYDDDPMFTACSGSCEGFQSDLNIHIFWHTKEGRVTIPAGTPLCQLVPVEKKRIPVELVNADNKTIKMARQRLLHKSNKFIL